MDGRTDGRTDKSSRSTGFPPDKFSFDIIDFVEATRLFNDPLFDGPPMRLIRDYTDEEGHINDTVDHTRDLEAESVAEPGGDYSEEPGGRLPNSDEETDEELDKGRTPQPVGDSL